MPCNACILCEKARTNCMPMAGDINSPILLIGEAPGKDEDDAGIPFVGKSGRLLRDALRGAEITDFAVTNICRCRPPNNRPPTKEEVDACIQYTWEDIESMPNLKLIVTIGNIALRALTGKQGITKVSGEEWDFPLMIRDTPHSVKLMPLMHPSYVLQSQDKELDRFFAHVMRIKQILAGGLYDESDKGDYGFISTIDSWRHAYNHLHSVRRFSYDLETTGLNPFDPESAITCIGFGVGAKRVYVLTTDGWTANEWTEILEGLVTLFTNKKIGKIGQNIKFDNLWMKTILGIEVKGVEWDTKIGEYLLEGKGATSLKDMAWKYSKLGGYEKKLANSPEKLSAEELWEYNAIDCDITYRAYESQRPRLHKAEGQEHLFKTLMLPASTVLMHMEHNGIKIDVPFIQEVAAHCDETIDDFVKQMKLLPEVLEFERAEDTEFNPNSPIQRAYIMYKILGLDVFKKTEKGNKPAADKEVLERYAKRSEFCRLLLDYSSYEQMRKTFLSELLDYERMGRIHTTLWLTETATGRTSSKKPNMQNMPKGERDILKIRKAFVADRGCVLVEPDMNQHELRVMAEIAHDTAMLEALKGDIHRATASAIFGLPPNEINQDQRREAKTVNFGIIYGLTSYGLSQQLGIPEEQADLWLYRFFEKYYMTKRCMEETSAFCKKYGYVEALSGRRRYFPSWEEFDDKKIKEAINFPVQASASDILLYGAIAVDRLLHNRKSKLVLEVHDSLLLNIHKSELGLIDEIRGLLTTYFKQFMPFESELKVDVKIGENWLEMEDYK